MVATMKREEPELFSVFSVPQQDAHMYVDWMGQRKMSPSLLPVSRSRSRAKSSSKKAKKQLSGDKASWQNRMKVFSESSHLPIEQYDPKKTAQ